MKRTFALLAAALTLSSLLTACAGGGADAGKVTDADTDAPTSAAETTVEAATEQREDLPEKNYNGFKFNFLIGLVGTKIFNNEHIWIEAENGETLNDAIFKRNRMVEERFGVEITETAEKSGSAAKKAFETAVLAGDTTFEAATTQGNVPSVVYLVDFHELKYVDLTAPWWDANVDAEQSVAGKLHTAYGSWHVTHIDPSSAMFFNKKLAVDYKCPDFYELSRTGAWTMDAFQSASKTVTGDIDGDGVFTDEDRYPYTSLGQNSWNTWMIGGGASFTSKDKDDLPILTMTNEKFATVFGKVESILGQKNFVYSPRVLTNKGTDGDSAIFRVFINDRTLFLTHGLGSVNQFRDMKSDYGLVPFPKLDEAQDRYYNTLRSEKRLFVPITNKDYDRAGIILEAMAAEGMRTLMPRYYETMLQNKYLRDEESIEMLDKYIIPYYSSIDRFGVTSIATAFYKMCESDSRDLASFLATNEAVFKDALAKVVQQ